MDVLTTFGPISEDVSRTVCLYCYRLTYISTIIPHLDQVSEVGYWQQRADERYGNPTRQPRAISGQR